MSIISGGGAVTGADAGPLFPAREYFNTVLWTGDSTASQAITGVGFQPDLVWAKSRPANSGQDWVDAVRGATKNIRSNSTAAEATVNTVISFQSDGFTVGNGLGDDINKSGESVVGWCWKANGAGSSNTDGSITSTVSAETDSGFSIVKFTGIAPTAGTVGHGLGVVPAMLIGKPTGAVDNWVVYHKSIGNTKVLYLNSTLAEDNQPNVWANTTPTSTVFSVGTNSNGNATGGMIYYCFAEVTDFSKIDSYTGNGSATGPSVTTGFQPTWLMIKRTDSTGDWIIHDSARDATNPRTEFLKPNASSAEETGNDVDFNATGFQIKSSSATVNASGGTYIYMCIA